MNKKLIPTIFVCAVFVLFPTLSSAATSHYIADRDAVKGAKVFLGFSKKEGANKVNYGFDPYGTYLSSFPSMNDNGDVAGRVPFTYIDPHTGEEVTQWEAAVWIEGTMRTLGVFQCISTICQSRALKINNLRTQIVGSSHGNIAGTTPYFERSIKWTSTDDFWAVKQGKLNNNIQSSIEDINNFDNLVGSAIINEDYLRHAQALIDGVVYTIGQNNSQSLGIAINSENAIVGSIMVEDTERAFRWQVGESPLEPRLLPSLAGGAAIAYDINDNNLIVGAAKNSEMSTRAVKWQDEEILELGTLGGDKSIARSVNNGGIIVGFAETDKEINHAFVYQDKKMYDLNQLVTLENGWVIVDAYTVNENGQILVRAQRNSSASKGDNAYWILSPEGYVPVPGPEMIQGNAYCQWGQSGCEIVYPPLPVENSVYSMPNGELPIISESEIPNADAYVCNENCEIYTNTSPMFSTITQAIENTNEFDSIVVLPGRYNESISLRFRKLSGILREYTIISTENLNKRPVSLKGYTELSHIAITGGNAVNGGGIQISGGYNLIDNVIVQGNTATRDGGGIHGLRYSEFVMKNSIISQNKSTYGGGYVSWSYGDARIEHSKFLHNEAHYGAGAFIASYTNIKFNANIVDGNKASIDGGGVYVNGYTYDKYLRNSLITNNSALRYGGGVYRGGLLGSIVYGNEAGVARYSAVASTISQNSLIWGNADANPNISVNDSIVQGVVKYCSYCSNIINQDPLFVDPHNGDFRLQAGSPAIDSGKNTSNQYGQMQDDDFNGIKRGIDGDGQGLSAGSDYDIGAFEYSPVF